MLTRFHKNFSASNPGSAFKTIDAYIHNPQNTEENQELGAHIQYYLQQTCTKLIITPARGTKIQMVYNFLCLSALQTLLHIAFL